MGVYGRLCVPRSIDSASIPQQPRDPSVMLLIVTPAGSRASARARQSGRWGGEEGGGMAEGRLHEVEREDGKKEQESWWRRRRIAGAEMEKERRMGPWSLWDCVARTAKLVSPSPCTFMSPHVPLCPGVSLDAKSLAQPDHLCSLYT